MKCPRCEYEQADDNLICGQCRISFEKFYRVQGAGAGRAAERLVTEASSASEESRLASLLFYVDTDVNPLAFGARLLLFLVLLVWGFQFITSPISANYAGNSILHLVNLPFHEAGHILFMPFGRLFSSMGGSVGQLIMPLICGAAILLQTRDTFGGSVCLWWLGESCMDLAPYIDDARRLTLPLLGGNTGQTAPYGFHDWQYILTELHLLHLDHTLARLAQATGIGLMLAAYGWGGYILLKQLSSLRA